MQMFNLRDPYDLVLLFLLVLLVILGAMLLARLFRRGKRFPWEKREELLDPAARSFFEALETALGGNFRVFPGMPLASILQPGRGVGKGQALEEGERIADIHLDFVVCRKKNLAVAGVVQFEGTPSDPRGKKPDTLLTERSLQSAGIPLARFSRDMTPSPQEIRQTLTEKGVARKEPEPGAAGEWRLGTEQGASRNEEDWQLGDEGRAAAGNAPPPEEKAKRPTTHRCPACGSEMVLRRAAKGPQTGKIFRVCSRYPECREFRPVSDPQG